MSFERAPFVSWEVIHGEVFVTTPDYKLCLDRSILPQLDSLSKGAALETEELLALEDYGVVVRECTTVTNTLYRLEKYFLDELDTIKIERKAATIPKAAIDGYGYRVTSDLNDNIGFGQDDKQELALLKALVEYYERVSCSFVKNKELLAARLPDTFTVELYTQLEWQLRLVGRVSNPSPSGVWVRACLVGDEATKVSIPIEYMCYPDGLEAEKLCSGSSNGVAAHTDKMQALKSSLFELVERDAFMLHWFNRVPADVVKPSKFFSRRIKKLGKLGFDVKILKLESIIGTVILSVLRRDSQMYPRLLLGLACNTEPEIAVNKALAEAELNVTYYDLVIKHPESQESIDTIMDHQFWYDLPANHHEIEALIGEEQASLDKFSSGPSTVEELGTQLSLQGFDWYYTELNAMGFESTGIYTIRSIVPGLVPIGFGYASESLGMPRLSNPPFSTTKKLDQSRLTESGYKIQPFS